MAFLKLLLVGSVAKLQCQNAEFTGVVCRGCFQLGEDALQATREFLSIAEVHQHYHVLGAADAVV